MELKQFSESYTPLLRETLSAQLAGVSVPVLQSAMAHLLGRGKLFRPLLALASYEACGGTEARRIVPLVTPLELIHTFTLIHDDLPCMDDAQLRRGVPALHVTHGEALAVLAGDALLNLALELLARPTDLPGELRLRLVQVATRATAAIVEGQVLDMLGEGRELRPDDLEAMELKKTGALIGACCESGALLAQAPDKLAARLHALGERVGLAFQVRDDLLSVEGSEEATGKTLSTDLAKKKSTYVRALGASGARAYLRRLVEEIEEGIGELGLPYPALLQAIARRAAERDR